jgi:hypothetical protein
MQSINDLLALLVGQPWAIPAIGGLATACAFLFGRRFLVGAPKPPPAPVEEPEANLQVLKALKPSAPDRRSMPRRRGNRVEVYLTDGSKHPPIPAWVVDRSMGGLCLIVEKPLPEGIILNVRPRQAPQTAPWTPIEIRSCRADDGEWECGCKFVTPPHFNDLLLFG